MAMLHTLSSLCLEAVVWSEIWVCACLMILLCWLSGMVLVLVEVLLLVEELLVEVLLLGWSCAFVRSAPAARAAPAGLGVRCWPPSRC